MFLYFGQEERELHVQTRMSSDVVLECTYTPRGRLHATLRRLIGGGNEKRDTEKQWFRVGMSCQAGNGRWSWVHASTQGDRSGR